MAIGMYRSYSNLDDTIDRPLMTNSSLARKYREKVCGYCADGMELRVMGGGTQPCEYFHRDAEGNMYPCLVAEQYKEGYAAAEEVIDKTIKQAAIKQAEEYATMMRVSLPFFLDTVY